MLVSHMCLRHTQCMRLNRFEVQRMFWHSKLGNLVLLPAASPSDVASADWDVKADFYRCVCVCVSAVVLSCLGQENSDETACRIQSTAAAAVTHCLRMSFPHCAVQAVWRRNTLP